MAIRDLAILLTLPLFLISGCDAKRNDSSSGTEQKVIVEKVCEDSRGCLRVHGSNTVGAKLMPDMVISFLKNKGAESVVLIQGETVEEKIVRARMGDSCCDFEIHGYGSSTGFNDLAWKKCDIAMSSKPINSESVSKLKQLGDMKSSECEHVLALDGIAILVNKKNPLSSIDIPVLKSIFSGAVKNWSEVIRGYEGEVNLYRRDNNSGTHEVFNELVLGDGTLSETAVVCLDNKEISRKVASDPFAIGYTSITFAGDNKSLGIIVEDGIEIDPENFNVQTEDYPLSRRLLLYTPEKKSELVKELLEYALGNKGQKVVEENGFVAQTLRLIKPAAPQNAIEEYLSLTEHSLRFSVNFRFNTGSVALDNRALADVNRLAKFIEEEKLEHCNLKLLGFSDKFGSAADNWKISRTRARIVANTIAEKANVNIQEVKGFGHTMPVASNATSQGRLKNRRVEVWISCPSE